MGKLSSQLAFQTARVSMSKTAPHRKLVKHYHEPGDFHELTFSCYHQIPLLTNDPWRKWLSESIDAALATHAFHLNAFVFMPEHVHLLVWPTLSETTEEDISRFLAEVKRPVSRRVKEALRDSLANPHSARLLKRLTIRNRPDSTAFRFWQEGPGYDRNLQTEQSVSASIDYIHNNPVRRGLVKAATDWKWSSARWYASGGEHVDPDLPTLHFPPRDLYAPTI
jgi:putative transposase